MSKNGKALTVLVSRPLVVPAIDPDEFADRFPDTRLVIEPYEISLAELKDRSEHSAKARPAEPLSPLLEAAFAEADVALTLSLPLNIARVAPLRWVQGVGSSIGQFAASGVDHLVCTNAAGANAGSIAEWVIAEVFALTKRLPQRWEQQSRHEWNRACGGEVTGSRALVVGLGPIGREVAWRLTALGVSVIGVRRSQPTEVPPGVTAVVSPERMNAFLPESEIVICAVTGSAMNTDMFDESFFSRMRRGSLFVTSVEDRRWTSVHWSHRYGPDILPPPLST